MKIFEAGKRYTLRVECLDEKTFLDFVGNNLFGKDKDNGFGGCILLSTGCDQTDDLNSTLELMAEILRKNGKQVS